MADAGEILLGRFGREFLDFGQLALLIFMMASHLLTFSVTLNTITKHATCTIVFGVVGLIVSFIGALPRTLAFISIASATIATMIALGVQAPDFVENRVTTHVSFADAFMAVTQIVFAYIAHIAYFGFISEMSNPRDFPKSLTMLQVLDTTMYAVTSMVIYRYAGPDVESPALSSAGSVMKRVSYGLAIPTVLIAGIIFGHIASKNIYVRIFRGSQHMQKKSLLSVGTWVGIALVLWTIAWIIAESIPVFNDLLSLISALFASWFCYGLPAIFWLFMNKGLYSSSASKIFLTIVNLCIVGIACAI
ncbi:hypothetical protein PHISP_08141, partial [Aspergillus sp. HF37]